MPDFSYVAKDQAGTTIKGRLVAAGVDAAVELLRNQDLFVVSIDEVVTQNWAAPILKIFNRVRAKDLTFFARQLSVMINANIPAVRALKTIGKQTDNPYFQEIISSVASEVDGGVKLSVAMSKYDSVFDQFFVQMIRSGETTGRLDDVLSYLATQKEQDYDVRSRIRGAMIYPAVIITVMIGIAIVMLVYVVPRLTSVITQSGGEIPLVTRVLLGTSGAIVDYWWLGTLIAAIIGGIIFAFVRTPQGKYYLDVVKLRLPVFGTLNQKIAITRFSISFSNLLASGVPVIKSLEIAGEVVNNLVINDIVQRTIIEVEGGHSISTVFAESKYIPAILPQMMSIGEETGQLDEVLTKLARFYTKEVEGSISVLTSLIEPLIIVILGIGALVLVAGIMTPIYSISNSIT